MADPKIKYDIEADVKGDASIKQLEGTLRELGETLDGDLKGQAQAAAAALAALGAKQDAITNFTALRRETETLGASMASAAQKVDQIGAQLPEASAATARFTEAQSKARAAVASAKADLDEQRGALSKLREEFTGSARQSDVFKESEAQLKVTVKDLRDNLASKKQELTASVNATKEAERSEKTLNTEYKNSVTAAREISSGLGAKNRALEASRSAMDSVGISSRNLAQSERNLDAAVAAVKQEVLGLAPAYRAAQEASNSSTQKQIQNQKSLKEGLTSISTQLARIQQVATVALGGSYVGGLLKDVAATADEFKNLEARIKLATGEGANFESGFKGVADIALRTNSALDGTATLFARIAKVGQEAGLGAVAAQNQSLAITETINQAVQLSGSSADASKAAVVQLIQGLQSGVLRGEEFNSVMEQAPRLAQALAAGLGATTGELRKMANQGQLTSEIVIKALRDQSGAVAQEFDKLPATVGRALQNLSTQWTLYVGAADNGMASSANAAKLIDALSKNLDTLVGLLYAAGKAFAAIKIAGLAADLYKYVAGTAAASAALQANSAALASNSAAHAANAVAARASGAASTAAATSVATGTRAIGAAGSVLGRFAGLLGPIGVGIAVLGPEIASIGRWLGEAAAKAMGYGKRMEEAERQTLALADAGKAVAAAQQVQNELFEKAKNQQFELSKAAEGLIGQFDGLKKSGDSAGEAVGKIGKDFDLSSLPGIRDAAGVLDKLLAQGKLTASEFQAAWAKALNGQDLAVFETSARAAFTGTKREAELLAQLLDANLREAIKRTGLDFDNLQGGISKASRSAVNDTQSIIDGLERLTQQGVDTGRALTASIGKGIDTADTQKALELVRQQIELVRSKLGDTIANGLLDQAKQKAVELEDALSKAKPGINGLREAMQELGLKTREELGSAAKKATEAYAQITKAGQQEGESYAAWQARKTQAAEVFIARLIEANGGIANESIKARAAMEGLSIQGDATGRSIVSAMSGGKQAVADLGGQVQLTNQDLEKQAALMDSIAAKYGQSKADRDSKFTRPGSDPTRTSDGNEKNADGSAKGTFSNTLPVDVAFAVNARSAAGKLTAADLAEAQAGFEQARKAKEDIDAFIKLSPGAASTAYIQSTNALFTASRISLDKVLAMTNSQIGLSKNVSTRPPTPSSTGQPDQPPPPPPKSAQEVANDRARAAGVPLEQANDPLAVQRANQAAAGPGQTPLTAAEVSAGVGRRADTNTGQSQTVNITINGQNTPVNVSSQSDANALTSILRELASAASRAA